MEHPEIIEIANAAITDAGYTPYASAARGGTDGARLSYMGLPCPNLGTGGANAHSRYEYVSLQEMDGVCQILKNIVDRYSKIEK